MGEKRIFGEGGGQRVSEQLTAALGHDVPLMAQLPLMPELRETGEEGRPAVRRRRARWPTLLWRTSSHFRWRDSLWNCTEPPPCCKL